MAQSRLELSSLFTLPNPAGDEVRTGHTVEHRLYLTANSCIGVCVCVCVWGGGGGGGGGDKK